MATSDDRRLIDNESSTTVDKFYGNKGGKDVQIPLAEAAAVLAEQMRDNYVRKFITANTKVELAKIKSGTPYLIAVRDAGYTALISAVAYIGGYSDIRQLCAINDLSNMYNIEVIDGELTLTVTYTANRDSYYYRVIEL